MDLSFARLDRDVAVTAMPTELAVLLVGVAARQAASPTACIQTRLALAVPADALLAPAGQKIISGLGDMHAVDPRVPGPRGSISLDELVQRSAPWGEPMLERGVKEGARVKADFSKAFSK